MGRPSSQTQQLAVAKLASSGLLPNHISATTIEAGDMQALGFSPFPALKIIYLHPLTKAPLRPRPHWPEFVRYRYLVDVPNGLNKKPIRYTQPPNTGVCAFFPHTVPWDEIVNEPKATLYITEGELKAAKACERGFPTIGLGGVWNFTGNATCTGFLPELEEFRWVRRKVVIVYDSDAREKPDVCKAINALAQELEMRGAVPYTLILPQLQGDMKCGLDDWFVAHPDPTEFRDLLRSNEQSLTLAQPLWELNEGVAYVRDPGLVIDTQTGQLMTAANFLVSRANVVAPERKVRDNGEVSLKTKPAAPQWLQWPFRREHGRLSYLPGQPTTPACYNTWKGWKSRPVKGSVRLFTQLIDHLFYTAPKATGDWFLRWLAYPIQHPGTKLYTAAVLHGAKKGTGKSFVGYCMREIYGDNWTEIAQDHLTASFNEWAVDKQFVMGDDVTGSDQRKYADHLKHLITRKEARINRKHLPSYVVPDCCNFLFTSNQPDAFFLEDGDRRFFVHEVTVDPMPLSFYHDLQAWIESDEGRNALHHYLLTLDLAGFDPRDPAPMTAAKAEMLSLGRSDLATWVAELRENPEETLKWGSQRLAADLFSSRDLLTLYDPPAKTRTTANAMARALKRAGFELVYKGEPISYGTSRERLFIARNHALWAKATLSQIRKHLEKTRRPIAAMV